MQGGSLAHLASQRGHTETLALLLANKADINATRKVQQFVIFKCFQLIYNDLQDFYIPFFILATILAHDNMYYYLTSFTILLHVGRFYASIYSFPQWTH
jgi:hypothetical protein